MTGQRHLGFLALAQGAALLLIVAGWRGASRTAALTGQVGWVNLAAAGGGLALVANGLFLLHLRRVVVERRTAQVPNVSTGSAPTGAEISVAPADSWIWLEGARRAHLGDCLLVSAKPTKVISDAEMRQRELLPCELCCGGGEGDR
ncbi:MAG TPA: hypothetical protein VHL53_17635 [Acidimicrobiia bacterium]|nr:hypothetical protein [Acidimicrobiia bacterium]